jgi:dolichol-phosphate mannosyltransferase
MANERESAESFVQDVFSQITSFGFRSVTFFAILDNVSKDGTLDLLRELEKSIRQLRVVYAPENRRVVDAYLRGYREALKAGCDWILEIDSGYSHRPDDIPAFFKAMSEGYDCVFGSRFCRGAHCARRPVARWLLSWGGTFLTNILLGKRLSDMTGGFELFSRDALSQILERGIVSRSPFFQTEIRAYARRFRITEVPIKYKAASHHISNAALADSLSNLWRLFKLRLAGTL